MYIQRQLLRLLVALLMVVSLSACDMSEQNFDFEAGDSLTISGTSEVTVPDTTAYFVRAFTIKKDYSWSVEGDGAQIIEVRREGEYVDVEYTEAGTYTISVSSNGQGDNYTGTLEVTALEPEE